MATEDADGVDLAGSPGSLAGGSPALAAVGAGGLIAFDFDGTLTVTDTFSAFLAWRTPLLALIGRLIRLMPAAMAYAVHRDRGRLKAAVVDAFWRGTPAELLGERAEAFAAERADSLLRPDALHAWEHCREGGAELVIVTASPEIVIAPFARRLKANRLIGTRLAVDPAGRLTGALYGDNCRGLEKVRRLRNAFGEDVQLKQAYGDSAGDREMLAMADQGFMRVFRGRPGS